MGQDRAGRRGRRDAKDGADSNSVANTISAQRAGEMDEAATTEADGGRSGCDRSAAQGRLGRAGNGAGAWSVAQRDQRGDRTRYGRPVRRRAGTSRGGSAGEPVGTQGQARAGRPAVRRGDTTSAAAVVAGADRRQTQAPGGWGGHVIRTAGVS